MTSPLLNRVTPKDTIETWRQKTNEIVDRLKDLYPHVDNNLYVENDAFIKGHLTVDGQLHVKANLIVDGTTTTINTTELNIEDNTILLNSNLTGTPPNVLESGIEVNRGSSDNKRIYWDEATDKWNIEGDLNIEGNFNDISGNSFQWGFDSNNNSIHNLNTGKVGIGTTNPDGTLHVKSSGTGAENVASFGNGNINSGLYIRTDDGNLKWGLATLNQRDLIFETNQTRRMTIDGATGNVGIGSSSPGAILNIGIPSNGTIGTLYTTTRNYNDSSNRVDLLFQYKYNSGGSYTTGSQISLAKESTSDGNYGSDIRFLTRENGQSSSEKMRIQGDGKVGIGTTSPSSPLHVAGTNSGSNLIALNLTNKSTDDGTSTAIRFTNSSITENFLSGEIAVIRQSDGSNDLRINLKNSDSTPSYPRMLTIDGSSGNVGIGETTPAEKLEVSGAIKLGTTSSTNTGTIRWSGSDFEGYTGSAWESLTSGGSTSVWSAGTSSGDIHYSSGDVGIGTNNPSAKLHIDVPNYSSSIHDSSPVPSLIVGYDSQALAHGCTAIGDSVTAGEDDGDGTFSGKYAIAMGYRTKATGTSSTAMGDFAHATGSTSVAMGYGTTASGSFSIAMGSHNTASGAWSTVTGSYTTASGNYSTAMGYRIIVSGENSFGIGLDTTLPIRTLSQDNTMAIMGGKVGIGTTSPSYELEVDGKIHASDGIHVLDRRADGDITPLNWSSKAVSTFFTDDIAGSSNTWDSGITVKGWDDAGSSTQAYRVWQLFSNSSNMTDSEPSASADDLYFRSGVGNTWGTKQKVWTDGNFDPTGYLPLSGGTITGVIDAGSRFNAAYRFDGRSFSWNSAMQYPTTHIPHIMQRTYGGWDPIMGIKTSNGFWQFGAYSNDTLFFGYMSGAFGSHSTNSFDDYLSISPTAMIFSGSISATGNITSTSDINLKENLEIIENPIEKIKQINGYTYNMIGKDERFAGLVAQEVEEVLPEVVRENIQGTKSLAYGNLMALLVETVKEQQKQIDELKKLISDK